MLLRRTAATLSRRTFVRPAPTRTFITSTRHFKDASKNEPEPEGKLVAFEDVRTEDDLLPPGAKSGTVPTDYEQSTGLERLEILGKMQGVDIFDMKPLDSSRLGTMKDPIMVNSAGDEQYAGCTGFPADSHVVKWLTISRKRPIERCPECGNVLKMNYIGPPDDPHDHHHKGYEEPKTWADYVKPEYYYR